MAPEPSVNIRRFEPRDAEQVRKITYDTALIGEPAALFFEGREIFSAALTAYFTDYEPRSCFVAEAGPEVVGCLLGAKDKVVLERIFNQKIAPGLFCRALREGILFKRKNIVFLMRCLADIARGRLIAPDFSREYPAILHINIGKGFRGLGIGGRLIRSYLDYLREERVRGVHLATMSEASAKFFAGMGFQLLHTGKRSYFRHILGRDVPLYIYGKKI